MRFLSAILFIALSGSVVLADEAKTAEPKPEPKPEQTKPKIPLRVVRMLPDTNQALLFDKTKGTHIVAELGTPLEGGFIVEDIGENDVTVSAEDGSLIVLAGPEKKKKAKVSEATDAPARADQPVDPYEGPAPAAGTVHVTATAPTATAPTATAAPTVTATTTVTVAPTAPTAAAPPTAVTTTATGTPQARPTATAPTVAPIVNAGSPALVATSELDPGIAAFVDAVGAVPAPGAASTATPASPPSISTAISPTPAAPAPAVATQTGTPIVAALKRVEVDAALGDFTKLSASFKGVFTPKGLRFDSIVPGSLLARAGFVAGDLVTSVDGKPLRSLDDAADLYALAWTQNSANVQVVRGGKTTTLRLAIQ